MRDSTLNLSAFAVIGSALNDDCTNDSFAAVELASAGVASVTINDTECTRCSLSLSLYACILTRFAVSIGCNFIVT